MEYSSKVYKTKRGVSYLKEPGIILLSKPDLDIYGIDDFLSGFPDLGFDEYTNDNWLIEDGSALSKVAGQLCYMSFGSNRTKNCDIDKYINHIRESGHGSILEHANYTFLFYGVSRSLTHELVRHRAGTSFSQVSQRFIDESKIRFVERPEFQNDPDLHTYFEDSIDLIMDKYREVLQKLSEEQKEGSKILYSEYKTELRKKIHQASRYILPNCTEAPIVVTANARAWRHFLEMRGTSAAETEIRSLAIKILCKLRDIQSLLFSDYEIVSLPDGTSAITTPYMKI